MEKTRAKDSREKWLFYGASAAAAALAARAFLGSAPASVQNFAYYADRGELLFHAVSSKAISYSMPLLSLLVSAAGHFFFDPALPAGAAALLLCFASYGLGARGGGRARGALFAFAAAAATLTCAAPEAEQVLYSLFLLVYLSLEFRRQADEGLSSSAAAGLAAGASMLIRSPLFAFPPLAVLFRRLLPGRKTGWLAAAALFLVCAYLPLAPWARLNHILFGRLIIFEEERSTCNIITGASGIVYTIEGDARAFAGLSRTESVYPWAIRTVLENPGRYAFSVARRAWRVFLMFPLLFLLAGAGFFLSRKDPLARLLAFFSSYFILIHCLLSVEERYFYPLRYALALLAAGGAWELARRAGAASEERGRDYFTLPLFALVLAAAAGTLGVVWRYPGAAKPALIAVNRELENYRSDAWLHRKKGEILLSLDLTREGLDSFEAACAVSGARDLCYISSAMKSPAPQDPPPLENYYELQLVKLMRELELGREAAAKETLAAALENWRGEKNSIKGVQFKEDENNLARIKESNKTFWDMDLVNALTYLPPEKRAGALALLSRLTPLTPKLRAIWLRNKTTLSASEKSEKEELRVKLGMELPEAEFEWGGTARALAAELLGGPRGPAGAGGELGLLLGLGLEPEELVSVFDTHCGECAGPAVKAAARAYLSGGKDRVKEARKLAAADPGNFAYALALLKSEDFSPEALKAAGENLKDHPYPLAAGALAWAQKGGRKEAVTLARAAALTNKLDKNGWSLALLAAQEAGDYKTGLEIAGLALRQNPGSSLLLNDRGVLRSLSGDATGAGKDFEAAVAADSLNFSALMNLGASLERAAEKEKAAQAYGRALGAARPGTEKLDAEQALSRVGKAQ